MSTGEKIKNLQAQLENLAAVAQHNISVLTDAIGDLERRDIAQKCALIRLAAQLGVPQEKLSELMHRSFEDSIWITGITDAFHALVASGKGAVRLRLVPNLPDDGPEEEIFGGDVAGTEAAP